MLGLIPITVSTSDDIIKKDKKSFKVSRGGAVVRGRGGARGKGKQAVVKANNNNKQGPNSFKGVANNNRGKNVARGGGRGGRGGRGGINRANTANTYTNKQSPVKRLNNRGGSTRGISNNRGGNNNFKRNNNNNNQGQGQRNNNNLRSNKFNNRGNLAPRRNQGQQRVAANNNNNNNNRANVRGAATMLQDQNTQVRQLQLLAKNQQLLQKQLQQLQNIQSRQNELLLSSNTSGRFGSSSGAYRDDRDLLNDRDVLMF